jgi:hypothetical protein
LAVAFEGPTEGLVLRKSPLSHRLRYHAHKFRCAFVRLLTHQHRHLAPYSHSNISLS